MNEYTILIIDDEYDERSNTYECFFKKKYRDKDATFSIRPIQTVHEFEELCREWGDIDAIFLDADLGKKWKDNYTCLSLLQKIERFYTKKHTPPLFMVSKVWKDPSEDLLMQVSIQLSKLEKFANPSAYYDFSAIMSIVEDANAWVNNFATMPSPTKLQTLVSHRNFILDEINKHQAMENVDAVIVLAVTDEKEKMYKALNLSDNNDKTLVEDGLVYQKTIFEGKRIALVTQRCMGLSEAARTTESAIITFEPSVVIMGGICAGNKEKVSIGSLVIPRQIFEYSSGKISDDDNNNPIFKRRLGSADESPNMTALYQFVENAANARDIITLIKNKYNGPIPEEDVEKKIVTYPLASGPWVIDSEQVFNMIKNQIPHDKFCAIDMEAYAFASVANIHKKPWLVVKTVQDYANGNKSSDEEVSRNYASFSSAEFIKICLKQIIDIALGK